ncbi:hypothetical protein BELL_0030g00230 [Botrytis elliptica]|uniref:Mid2 domain-containing protein n=1 Tax=Botrytis elliptica TaxID=278938 RepID=A0A4Z1K133_9HELO|nr:hypothetical protein EAE99_004272 [Botrytis elliptica]TGO79518.1 hypothetical protein BELL_0030g00230 [Botrytis elliptica]
MYYSRNYFLTFLTCFSWSIGYTGADDHGVVFLYPTDNLTINYLDTVNVTYTSPFPEPQLWIYCQNITDLTGPLITESYTTVTAFNGSAPINWRWLGGSPCWFDLKPNASNGYGANSEHFIVDQNQRASPTTLGLPLPTDSSTSTTSTSISTTASASSDATTTATPNPTTSSTSNSASAASASSSPTQTGLSTDSTPATGLSGGAKAGIGIGIAIVALLALAAGFFFWRKKQAKKTHYTVYPTSDVPMNEKMEDSSDYSRSEPEPVAYEMYAPEYHIEMPGTQPVRELGEGEIKSQATRLV